MNKPTVLWRVRKTWQNLAKARKMIEDRGYHRRDGEVAELERALKPLKH